MDKSKKHQSFGEFIKHIENPNSDYPWVAKGLSPNATPLEKAKYELCQKILTYQMDNNLTDEELSRQTELSKEQTLQILFSWIEKFTLDDLITYVGKLFLHRRIEISIDEKTSHVRIV